MMKKNILILALVFLVIGCNSSSSSKDKDKNEESEIIMPPVVTHYDVSPSFNVSGFVYLRESNISYDLNLTSTTRLNCDTISLNDTNGVCSDDGSYSLNVNTLDYDSISVTKTDYIPIKYSVWEDKNQTIPLGLYNAPVVGKKDGFMKGMVFLDLGNTYPFSFWEQVIDEPKSGLNAELVSYVYNAFNHNCSTTKHNLSISSFHPQYPEWRMPTESELAPLVKKVHNAGMKFNLWLDLVDVDKCGNGAMYSWDTNDTDFWDSWFSEYDKLLQERAKVAKNLGIEWLTLGHNFAYASRQNATRWDLVIKNIKSIYPDLKVSYFGGTDFSEFPPYFESESYNGGSNQYEFANLFDAIGYMVHTVSHTQNPSRDSIKAVFEAIETNSSSFEVPVWISPMTPSTTKGASDATFMEPELLSNDIALSYTTDFYQQADVYEALFEVINASSGGDGHIMGVLPWGYHLKDNYRDSGKESNSNPNIGNLIVDKTANIRGKPAQSIVKWWYSKL